MKPSSIRYHVFGIVASIFVILVAIAPSFGPHLRHVPASLATEEVGGIGDAADDPAIWIHPEDPGKSLILATDKTTGLVVFDLSGKTLQRLDIGKLNNVDVRDGFLFKGRSVSLAAAGNRTDDTVALFEIDAASREVKVIGAIASGLKVYGSCLYRSPEGDFYVFVNAKTGDVIQWKLRSEGQGEIKAERVRSFHLGSQVEACVADDENRSLYISEEDVGIWKFKADPAGESDPVSVDHVGPSGHLTADVEGLAIYRKENGTGYLIASSQGENAYALYERQDNNKFISKFSIGYEGDSEIVRDTDGLDVTSINLSPAFPKGMLVVQDGWNKGRRQNFKIVSWADIERVEKL